MKKIIFDTVKNLFLLEDGRLEANTIIYPTYRNKPERRISEQEAKQIFIHEVIRNGIRYSVETPTRLPYSFSGETPLSGNIDVSTYSPDLREQTNIEFKATNCAYGRIFRSLFLKRPVGSFFTSSRGVILGHCQASSVSIGEPSPLSLTTRSLLWFLYL